MRKRIIGIVGGLSAALSFAACSDNSGGSVSGTAGSAGNGGSALENGGSSQAGTSHGGSNAGASSGGANAGAATGGASAAGATNGGSGGSSDAQGGASTGGAGTGGTSSGGTSSGGTSSGGAGTSGSAGEGGTANPIKTTVFDFETDAQGWTTDGQAVTVAVSTEQSISGSHALKVTMPPLTNDNRLVFVDGAAFWPGTVVTLNVWSPAGTDSLYLQAFSLIDFYQWDATASTPVTVTRGGWTTWTYVVPKTFPGGMQRLGIQFGAGAGAFAGGAFYVDAIATSGGSAECSGASVTRVVAPPERTSFDFESATPEWEVDGAPSDTAITLSADQKVSGASSLKVALNAIPAAALRRIRVPGPNVFCSQQVTLNVWTPAGSDALTFQIYAQYNNWVGWASSSPTSITRNGWTAHQLTLPNLSSTPAVGPGGIEALGIEFNNTGSGPFTGNVYIDDVSW